MTHAIAGIRRRFFDRLSLDKVRCITAVWIQIMPPLDAVVPPLDEDAPESDTPTRPSAAPPGGRLHDGLGRA